MLVGWLIYVGSAEKKYWASRCIFEGVFFPTFAPVCYVTPLEQGQTVQIASN